MWNYLADSVTGSSHAKTDTPCQDFHRVTNYSVGESGYLVIACSDGAGSASHAEVGSKAACDAAVEQVCAHLSGAASLAGVDRGVATDWVSRIRGRLAAAAGEHSVELRQVACTLLLAVIGDEESVFVQIGDGAIVGALTTPADAKPEPIFWPQNGEYANTTYFLTDPRVEELMLFDRRDTAFGAVSAFTDGLQALALNLAGRCAHEPFFAPMFKLLTDAVEPSDLNVPFRQFLNSKAVNDRTDDDKTLVIAVRTANRDR